MQDAIPVHVASYNTRGYTELCVRSLHRFADRPFELIVGDSDSRDGSAEMLEELAREGWLALERSTAPRRHAVWLDQWLAGARAEHLVFCDSDIQFLRTGFLRTMQHAAASTGAAIVSPGLLGHAVYADERLVTHLMPRPVPWLMMVDAPSLRSLQTSYEEFTEPSEAYPEGKRTFDVGGMLYQRALAAGMTHASLGWRFRRKFRHYGGASWTGAAPAARSWRHPRAETVEAALESARRRQSRPSTLARVS